MQKHVCMCEYVCLPTNIILSALEFGTTKCGLPSWKSHSYILSRYSVLLPLTELMGLVNWDIWRHLDDQVSRIGWRKDYHDLLKYRLAFDFCPLYYPIPGPRFHPWSPISGFSKVWKVILSWKGTPCLLCLFLPDQSWWCTWGWVTQKGYLSFVS